MVTIHWLFVLHGNKSHSFHCLIVLHRNKSHLVHWLSVIHGNNHIEFIVCVLFMYGIVTNHNHSI